MEKLTIFQMPYSRHLKSKYRNVDIFPFTKNQLTHFQKEMDTAGGFHALMFQKKALEHRLDMKYITKYCDVKRYREKYLIGVYQSLQPFYDTEMPFIFWSEMYEVLLTSEFDRWSLR